MYVLYMHAYVYIFMYVLYMHAYVYIFMYVYVCIYVCI